MKLYDVSQLPVLDRGGDESSGILDESDLLLAVEPGPGGLPPARARLHES